MTSSIGSINGTVTRTTNGTTHDINVEELKDQFAAFLRQKKYRNTQERFLVIDGIVKFESHFSADELYLAMRQDGVNVSRATIYSTLDLLTKCSILMKHRFSSDSAHFELADKMPNHDHLICTECGHIVEFQEEALNAISERVSQQLNFTPLKHSLQIFAVCNDIRNCEYNKS
jgi:Fur family ferric uptake transcriptional regulator